VQELSRYLATSLGAEGESMVLEAARRCRTKMQLCMRLANAVGDPALKDMLLRRALGGRNEEPPGVAEGS
jgi:hypothetical protein